MALQFADCMLQPPPYPPLYNRVSGGVINYLIEREQNFWPRMPPAQSLQLAGDEAPSSNVRVSQWLEEVERATGQRRQIPGHTLGWLKERVRGDWHPNDANIRVSRWLENVEDARGDWLRAQQKKPHTQGGRDAAAKAASAKMRKARDSLRACLQSVQPTLELVRERHAALLRSMSKDPRVSQRDPLSGQNMRKVCWSGSTEVDHVDDEEIDYLVALFQSEWLHDDEKSL
ncbi:hypothetical protein VUR80DRAFT_2584 [Thermomyces stellatus]